jgi:cardiolipin synthase
LDAFGVDLSRVGVGVGVGVEVVALALVPLVLVRRKEPPSTVAWILALVFLPGLGATLFLLFGRDRVKLPARWKRAADRELAERRRAAGGAGARKRPTVAELFAASAGDDEDGARRRAERRVARSLFRVGAALAGAQPTPHNEVELLVDGDATYEAIGRAIDQASTLVLAEYYLFREDTTATWLRDRLVAAAERGCAVKLLLDGYGSFGVSRRFLAPLRAAGAEVAFFLPARLLLLQPMNLRNHRKIVIVDHDTAFTGGINVGDEYRGHGEPWRDAHLAIRGPAARDLGHVFAEDWHFATGRVIAGERPHGSLPPRGAVELADGAPATGRGEAMVAVVRSGPDLEGPPRETIHRLFFVAIALARTSVHVTTPYLVPDRAIVVALQTAAARGVDVTLLVPSRSNHRVVGEAGRSFYEELLGAGVRIFEFGPGMIHAKTMVVDGAVSLVGSANMDLRSFRLNFEVHTVVRDRALSRRLEETFDADLAVSREIELDAFRARPAWRRVTEGAARLLSPLM